MWKPGVGLDDPNWSVPLGIFYDSMIFNFYLLFSLLFPFFVLIFNTLCPDLTKEMCRQCLLRLHGFSQS